MTKSKYSVTDANSHPLCSSRVRASVTNSYLKNQVQAKFLSRTPNTFL